MSIFEYVNEKLGVLLLNITSCTFLSFYLFALGLNINEILLIWISWGIILLSTGTIAYLRLAAKYRTMQTQLSGLDQKYMIAELLSEPDSTAEIIYYKMLKTASKSMLEEISIAKREYRDYKEYIEEWIHEVKTPISAVNLLCRNHPSPENKKIMRELFSINHLVEQALYYARSGCVENDYFIREFPVYDAVAAALSDYRTLLLANKIQILTDERTDTVFTDEKWLTFIIGQIISNAVKYHGDENPRLQFNMHKAEKGNFLFIEDNGQGILPEDLPRIFEKGFTGGNRKNRTSTGMGLYLCHKLCCKLRLSIEAESETGQFTRIAIGFPKGKMHRPESW